jgi:hypothetical protein
MKAAILAGLVVLAPTLALAEGCALDGGTVIGRVEAMNQMVLDLDIPGLVAAIKQQVGIDVAADMGKVAEIFADGFNGCTTIAQRVDQGGMVQNVVMFDGKVGPLFGYWLAVPQGNEHRIISFTFHTDLDQVMGHLR